MKRTFALIVSLFLTGSTSAQLVTANLAIDHEPPAPRSKMCLSDDSRQRDERSHGGGFAPQLIWLDPDLFTRLKRAESGLDTLDFNFGSNRTLMLGGLGYTQDKYGMRGGSGFWIGYKKFTSREYTRLDSTDSGSVENQWVTLLRVVPVYTGALIEKGFDLGYVTLYGGGFIGGGAYLIHKQNTRAGEAFVETDYDNAEQEQEELKNHSFAVAPFFTADAHAGVSVLAASHVNIGAEYVLLFTYSPDGFVTGAGMGDFTTLSHAIRLRLDFGH